MRKYNNAPRFIYTGLGFLAMTFAVGCAKEAPAIPAPVATDTRAVASPGDLVPSRLFKLAAPADLALEKAVVSMPGTPRNVLKATARPPTLHFKETIIFVAPGSSPGDVMVPVDETDGTVVYVGGTSTDAKSLEESTKDVSLVTPDAKVTLNKRAPRVLKGVGDSDAALKSSDTSFALKAAAEKPLNAINLEPSMQKGMFTLKFGSVAGKHGVTLDVRLPKSPIDMAVTPSASTFLAGDDGTILVELADADAAVTGATLEAELVRPDGSKAGTAAVRELGNGKYEVFAAKSLNESSAPGVWNVFLRARGTAHGLRFDRYGAAAFELAIPTARIASATTPRLIKNDTGQVESFEVEVAMEVASLDRYELSATLVSIDPDGTERPVALGQTAIGLDAGNHKVALRFDAGYVKLTTLEGAFALRSLQLFSQGRNSLLQRHERGLDLRFPTVNSGELVGLREITPAVQLLIDNGEFDLTKTKK